jgi:hypothetical protein
MVTSDPAFQTQGCFLCSCCHFGNVTLVMYILFQLFSNTIKRTNVEFMYETYGLLKLSGL